MTSGEGLFARLSKTRQSLFAGLLGILKGNPTLGESLYDDVEDQLLMADLGVQTSQTLLASIREKAKRNKYSTPQQLLEGLRASIIEVLEFNNKQPGEWASQRIDGPRVILMVGVNGAGKTTTLAKLANHYKNGGRTVMMAACDTFRAAAIEQLQVWGKRLDIAVVAQSHGSDAAAVAYDAYSAASTRQIDYLLIDSAGRQHTQTDLMAQLKKIERVLSKANVNAPHEVYITVDAGNGQNVLSQVENFNKTIALTGLCITKLDGTARGGVVIALAGKFKLPIKYIGIGEGVDDLKPFDAKDFVEALLPDLPVSQD